MEPTSRIHLSPQAPAAVSEQQRLDTIRNIASEALAELFEAVNQYDNDLDPIDLREHCEAAIRSLRQIVFATAPAAPQRAPTINRAESFLVLTRAIRSNAYNTVLHLLDKGYDPNAQRANGDTPLIIAAREGHRNIVDLLISRGANVNHAANDSWTPLLIAVKEGRIEVVRALLAAPGIELTKPLDSGMTPLQLCVNQDDIRPILLEALGPEASD